MTAYSDPTLVWQQMMQVNGPLNMDDLRACQQGCCASLRVYGSASCGVVIEQIVQNKGLLAGLPHIYAQLLRCRDAARQLSVCKHGQTPVSCCVWPALLSGV